jgi:erythronate-4-phosphate dehydrogenase
MRIVADKNITYVESAFAELGKVVALPARELSPEAVREADLVLVRSTVRVDRALLEGSRARFVATATSGIDHLDTEWLEARGIAWAAAPGSNAPSVARWFAAGLLTTALRQGRALAGLTVGVVGVGQVGRRVEQVARALGCAVLRNDPPRARAEGETGFVPLDELLGASDVVTLHVPLDTGGPDRTLRLLDSARLARMRPGAWLVNASRGEVVESDAAIDARMQGRLGALLLDVFAGEPEVAPSLVAAADLATPHVAGHSLDGKAAGTEMVYRAACTFLGVAPRWSARRALPPLPTAALAIDARTLSDEEAALTAVRRFYRIEEDDAALRRIAALPDGDRALAFQRYRASYPERREMNGLLVEIAPPRPRALALVEALGAVRRDG